MLKHGTRATKHGRDRQKRLATFKLDEEESSLSWEGTARSHEVLRAAGKVLRAAEKRCLLLEHVLDIHVGRPEDATALEKMDRLSALELHRTRASFHPGIQVEPPVARQSSTDEHLLVTLLLRGALPTPPSLDDEEPASSARQSVGPRRPVSRGGPARGLRRLTAAVVGPSGAKAPAGLG